MISGILQVFFWSFYSEFMASKTLYDKIWQKHVVKEFADGTTLLYIDKHLLHEVTSPQAFSGLRQASRLPWRLKSNLATVDHAIPTVNQKQGLKAIKNDIARAQVAALNTNCQDFGIETYGLNDPRQGIVHIIGPEQGITLPGITLVCGDSHTSTHGAFAAIAFGIGTSEVEHALATQCVVQKKARNMRAVFTGTLPKLVGAKDMILHCIARIGTAGGTGYAIEYMGEAVSALSMAGRMTLCNMTIEAGARCGLVAVDDTTLSYIKQRPLAPQGELWQQAEDYWRTLHSDTDADFAAIFELNVSNLRPQVSWGTSPELTIAVDEPVPNPRDATSAAQAEQWQRSLEYMGLHAGDSFTNVPLDAVFIGSCTNARLEDLRLAADVVKQIGTQVAVQQALVVPGSQQVKKQAEQEGLDEVFKSAGFEWREPGCSMCLGMNDDILAPQQRAASTSNRNFEGRQGKDSRTHLVSPAMAAAAALHGHFVNVAHL